MNYKKLSEAMRDVGRVQAAHCRVGTRKINEWSLIQPRRSVPRSYRD